MFSLGYLSSGHTVCTWARMWGSVVIFRSQKGFASKKVWETVVYMICNRSSHMSGCPNRDPAGGMMRPVAIFLNCILWTLHSNLGGVACYRIWFLHVQPLYHPTVTIMALWSPLTYKYAYYLLLSHSFKLLLACLCGFLFPRRQGDQTQG
jgi:hypothetical protein